MRIVWALFLCGALGACSEILSPAEVYTCPNGPDLQVQYSDEGAEILFDDGTTQLLPPAGDEQPRVYAKPGFLWETGFRSARLTDDTSSYHCDLLSS